MTPEQTVGHQVYWEKMNCTEPPAFGECYGFGTLSRAEVGQGMRIEGDYGLFSSVVKEIESINEGIKVTTANSTYLVKVRKKAK